MGIPQKLFLSLWRILTAMPSSLESEELPLEKNLCFHGRHANRMGLCHLVAAILAGKPKPMVLPSDVFPFLPVL